MDETVCIFQTKSRSRLNSFPTSPRVDSSSCRASLAEEGREAGLPCCRCLEIRLEMWLVTLCTDDLRLSWEALICRPQPLITHSSSPIPIMVLGKDCQLATSSRHPHGIYWYRGGVPWPLGTPLLCGWNSISRFINSRVEGKYGSTPYVLR